MATIDIEVYCECGNLLNSTETKGDIEVEPCEQCLEVARKEGYDERDQEG